jgi:hypothetical protein
MRAVLIMGLVGVISLAGCSKSRPIEKKPVEPTVSSQDMRSAELAGYRNDCINEYGFDKNGGDPLAACIQSKDETKKKRKKTYGKFVIPGDLSNLSKTLGAGSYTFKN